MDLPLYTDSESEETAIEDDADIDDAAFDNPRCGICMDVVIDRGVLDCCQDWFCFACIDNWATITNLCPFCKNEFQLITCVPVYDTVGSINSEDHSFSRDDEWLIQGKNNTLSFPSYYINEEAVVCLDGDDCKIRGGFATFEDELNVDTSIACDSCDIWYHAFCVGFNSSCTSNNSWLCPRCVSKQGAHKPEAFIMQNIVSHYEPKSVDLGWSVDYPFAGKVSVSVADTGDTDVVISMVEEKPRALASENLSSTDCLDVESKSIAINMTSVTDGSYNVEIGFQADKSGCGELVPCSTNCDDQNNLKDKFPVVPSIHDALLDMKPIDHKFETSMVSSASQNPSSTSFDPKECGFLRPEIMEEKFKLDNNIDICKIPKPCSAATDNGPPLNISVDNIHPDPSAASCTSVDLAKDKILGGIGEDADSLMLQCNFEDGSLVEEDVMKTVPDTIDADFLRIPDRKREREMEEEIEVEYPMKKTRSDGKHQVVLLEKVHNFALDSTKKDLSPMAVKDDALKHTPGKDGKALDIMSLVQENKHRESNTSSYTDSTERLMQKRDGAAGLRVKKIMRSVGDNKESSVLIQKLRKEIREAVQDKTPNIIDKVKILNGELLTAFRAALARPQNEVVDRPGVSHVPMRKPFLQKGKTRENLTKKIYQTSTGRRKKAWDRDCEVEFWKRRCMIPKPQKVETLQSVLELVRKASSYSLEDTEIDLDPHMQTADSILSRVYLADASVFPRKDDIKPLSVLEGCQGMDSHNQQSNISGKDSQHVCATKMTNNAVGISDCRLHGKVPSTDNGEKKLIAPNSKKEAPCQKGKSNGAREAPPRIVGSSSFKESTLNSNEASKHSCLAKTDKKKWALEVLARKNALSNADASKGNQEDRSPLNGNYQLLAQLPADMMPMPAPSRFNKVSLSVRQAQLNRIAEHYLRRTNLSPMRRTAATELAVADAVNVEKDIVERSNSKLVYVNLCSQVLSQRKTKPQTSENITHSPIATSTHDTDFKVEVMCSNSVLAEGDKVEEALKLAGLDDTPPNSPCRPGTDTEAEDTALVKVRQEDLTDSYDVHSHPDSNVFGDSVHILDDGGFIISSRTMDAGLLHPEDSESRIKVVPSSVNCAKSGSKCAAQNFHSSEQESITTDQHDLGGIEASSDTSTMLACQSYTHLEVRVPVLQEPSHTDFNKDPSFEECEENRVILDKKLSVEVTGGPGNNMETDAEDQHQVCCDIKNKEKSNKEFLKAEVCTENNLAEGSPSHSLISKKVPTDGIATVHTHADSAKSISRKVGSLHQRTYQASVQKWYHNSAAVQVGSHEDGRKGYEIPLQGQECKFSYQRRSQGEETC